MLLRKSSIIILLCLSTVISNSQTTDEQLASHYFLSGEYDKAALYYEKLWVTNPIDQYYNKLLKCLIQLEDYNSAEKLIKKQIRKYGEQGKYLVDLGYIYSKNESENKALQQYEKAIKLLEPNQNQIISLSKSFIMIGEYDYALNTLMRGRKLMHGYYPFNFEIADIYGILGDYSKMISEYLNILDVNENYLQSVQNSLAQYFSFDKNSEQNNLLKLKLIKRIQRNPGRSVFSEMLIWIYLQQKDFRNAYTQTMALDKRMKEQGERLFSLAKICTKSDAYDVALDCYHYIIEYHKNGYYYIGSKIGILNVMDKKITSGDYTYKELNALEKEYYSTLEEFGIVPERIELIKKLAHLQIYYLHKTDSARTLLENVINEAHIKSKEQAECKLLLGDVMLMQNEIWDASLLYSQVEKSFKYSPIGDEAKFRNAKIAFYTGDFLWAKSKLDILKGSTSKLIANDAMYLSLLISDNIGIDTTERPLVMFARAELSAMQNKNQLAFQILDSINLLYPNHSLEDDILYQRYKIFFKKRDYANAEQSLLKIIEGYSYDILGDDATYHLAQLYDNHIKNKDKAIEYYHDVLVNFPGSTFAVEARERYRELRGDNLSDSKRDLREIPIKNNP